MPLGSFIRLCAHWTRAQNSVPQPWTHCLHSSFSWERRWGGSPRHTCPSALANSSACQSVGLNHWQKEGNHLCHFPLHSASVYWATSVGWVLFWRRCSEQNDVPQSSCSSEAKLWNITYLVRVTGGERRWEEVRKTTLMRWHFGRDLSNGKAQAQGAGCRHKEEQRHRFQKAEPEGRGQPESSDFSGGAGERAWKGHRDPCEDWAGDGPTGSYVLWPVVLRMWFPDRQHQYLHSWVPLELQVPEDLPSQSSDCEHSSLWFHMPSRWFWCPLEFAHHCYRPL